MVRFGKHSIMENEKLFVGTDSFGSSEIKAFDKIVSEMTVTKGYRHESPRPTIPDAYVLVAVPIELSNKKIQFILHLKTGKVTVIFTLDVSNQQALWAVRGGAHAAEITYHFPKFTTETAEGLAEKVKQYLVDQECVLDMCNFKKEEVPS